MLSTSDLKTISLNCIPERGENITTHIFRPNQVIFYKGHFPYGIFILLKGEIKLEYSEKVSENVKECSILGINSLLNNTEYLYTVKTVSTCKVCFLSTNIYKDLLLKNHPIVTLIKS